MAYEDTNLLVLSDDDKNTIIKALNEQVCADPGDGTSEVVSRYW